MYSFIFTIIIWLLVIPIMITNNLTIAIVLFIIQILLLVAQIIYVFFIKIEKEMK